MNSLSDQLLKAGLITEDQVKKVVKKPKRPKVQNQPKPNKRVSVKKEASDLAQFYKQRARLERYEKQQAIKKKQLAAKLKKETNDKINKLIFDNLLNDDKAEIRYNFVVGTTIKYLFVTKEQQQKLANGDIAITFLGGKRSLIPVNIAKQITRLNPDKIVIFAT